MEAGFSLRQGEKKQRNKWHRKGVSRFNVLKIYVFNNLVDIVTKVTEHLDSGQEQSTKSVVQVYSSQTSKIKF